MGEVLVGMPFPLHHVPVNVRAADTALPAASSLRPAMADFARTCPDLERS
jgi:hypothetical protein